MPFFPTCKYLYKKNLPPPPRSIQFLMVPLTRLEPVSLKMKKPAYPLTSLVDLWQARRGLRKRRVGQQKWRQRASENVACPLVARLFGLMRMTPQETPGGETRKSRSNGFDPRRLTSGSFTILCYLPAYTRSLVLNTEGRRADRVCLFVYLFDVT